MRFEPFQFLPAPPALSRSPHPPLLAPARFIGRREGWSGEYDYGAIAAVWALGDLFHIVCYKPRRFIGSRESGVQFKAGGAARAGSP